MTLGELFNNTIFLLGAGASKDAGCLMSCNMLDKLSDEIINIPSDFKPFCDYKEGFKQLYRVIKPSLEYQAEYKRIESGQRDLYTANIEDYILILRKILNKDYIIPEPLVGSWSEKLLLLEIKYPNLCQQYLDFIYYCVIKWLDVPSYDAAENLLTPLKQLLQDTTAEDYFINIFTLNYDLVFEKVFNSEQSQPLNSGFSDNVWDDTSFNTPQTKINLYKIHGSLDWYKNEDETKSMKNHDVAFNPLEPSERKPHIILGYESKLFSVDPFFTILQTFIEKLKNANLLVVIGYSFFDAYLNNILIKFLHSDDNNRMLIVDPKFASDNPEDRFVSYLKTIQADPSTLNIDNYTTLPSSKISFYKAAHGNSGAKEFYEEYFANRCEKLIADYADLSKADEPFK